MSTDETGEKIGDVNTSRMGTVRRNLGFLMKVFVAEIRSLDHQTQFVSLVAPITWEALLSDVVRGKTADFGFRDLKRSLVVNVLVVSRTEVIDDGHSLSHQIHHVLGIGAGHVGLSENLADALSEDKSDVGNGVLVSQNRTNFSGGHSGLCQVQNEGLNGIFVGV